MVDITCPECHGQRQRYYIKEDPVGGPPLYWSGEDSTGEATVTILEEPCRTCKGKGWIPATEPIPVIQDGRQIGTVPPNFDPALIKSRTRFYSPRPGDFKREGDTWVASGTLGPGDLDAVPGFVRGEKGNT